SGRPLGSRSPSSMSAINVLQALSRGSVRKSDGGKCQPMTAYIIASKRSGIPKDLPTIFPGCRVLPWGVSKKAPSASMKTAIKTIQTELQSGAAWIPLATIRDAIGFDKSDFRRLISSRPEWSEALAELGVETTIGPRGAKGLKKVTAARAA